MIEPAVNKTSPGFAFLIRHVGIKTFSLLLNRCKTKQYLPLILNFDPNSNFFHFMQCIRTYQGYHIIAYALCSFSARMCNSSSLMQTAKPNFILHTTKTIFINLLAECHLLFDTKNSDFSITLLSCLVFKLQEPPSLGLKLTTIFLQSSDISKISYWSQEISMWS